MTLHEAIGVRVDIDIETGEKLTHSEIFGRAIEFLGGLDEVARFVPFPVETLREKLKSDKYLNNTPMSAWDRASGFQCGVLKVSTGNNMTAAQHLKVFGNCTASMESTLPAIPMACAS